MKPTMMTYIHEEQAVTADILDAYPQNVGLFAELASQNKKEWLILATGSSINAALSAKYYIEKVADVRIDIKEPFNFTHYDKVSPHCDLVLGISQSGQSTSTIGAMARIREQTGLKTIAFTSDVTTAISEVSDVTIDIGCGKERVGYVTKGFIATVLTLMLAGLRTAVTMGRLTESEEQAYLAKFRKASMAIPNVITKTEAFFEKHKVQLASAPRFTAIGYGPTVGTAKEIETKFSETVRLPSQGIDLEAFMHGPYLEVNPQHRIFFIETESPIKERIKLLQLYESNITPYTYTVTLDASTDVSVLGLDVDLDEYMAPLFMIIPFQILAHHIAGARGIDLTQRIYTDFGVAMKSKTQPGDYA
ncbi:SIS domain-containing protein [Paenibacillus sp. N3.4]|uniref:SIS domain-containing protein n=1 Tax=Paenibacillus sp. N3.4 TaxID=2603222 RepID=UPI0011CC6125|nr:SIS domain-containing protein [Paenibacillus sp. N3.4]TXK84610.1 SIS domain-containing protein [Paenibacillus sp. N3.4]